MLTAAYNANTATSGAHQIVKRHDDGSVILRSGDSGILYAVDQNSCTCPDHQCRDKKVCKHIVFVRADFATEAVKGAARRDMANRTCVCGGELGLTYDRMGCFVECDNPMCFHTETRHAWEVRCGAWYGAEARA